MENDFCTPPCEKAPSTGLHTPAAVGMEQIVGVTPEKNPILEDNTQHGLTERNAGGQEINGFKSVKKEGKMSATPDPVKPPIYQIFRDPARGSQVGQWGLWLGLALVVFCKWKQDYDRKCLHLLTPAEIIKCLFSLYQNPALPLVGAGTTGASSGCLMDWFIWPLLALLWCCTNGNRITIKNPK